MSQSVRVRESETTDARECPECSGDVRRDSQDQSVCEDCGLIVEEDQIDRGPEWRRVKESKSNEESVRRTGPGTTESRHDHGLTTEIGRGNYDANGNQLSARKRQQLKRIRREQSRGRFRSHGERTLGHAFGEIQRMGCALGLSRDRREQACRLYRTAQNEGLIIGRCIEAMAGASIYGMARCQGHPITLTDVAEVARVDYGGIKQSYRVLNRELELPTKPPEPQAYVPKVVSELDVSTEARRLAERMAGTYADVYPGSSVTPVGVAAGAVYFAGQYVGDGPTQAEVADVADVTKVTLRDRFHELDEVLEALDDV